MSVTANTELGLKRLLQLRAHSRVHVVLRVDVSLDLGFHVVIGVGRLNLQQEGFIRQLHFTTHTQHQVQSSFLLDVVVRLCPVIVHPSCKFLHISHRENGSFEVLVFTRMGRLFCQIGVWLGWLVVFRLSSNF